jgi:hypothetical protein
MHASRRYLVLVAAFFVFASAHPATASPILLTGGTIGITAGIDLPGFIITGTDDP